MANVTTISRSWPLVSPANDHVSSSAMLDPALFGAPYDFMLAKALGEAGVSVELVARPRRPVDPVLPEGFGYAPFFSKFSESIRSRIPRQLFSVVKGAEYVLDSNRLVGHLLRNKPSVVHYLWLPFAIRDVQVIRRLRRHFPLVHTMHNKVPFHGAALSLQRVFRSEWLQLFDTIIVHTGFGPRTRRSNRLSGERIFVLQHPPLPLAEPTSRDRAAVAKKRKFRVLMWGALKPYKGVDVLLQASRRLSSQGVEHELVLAGQPFFDVSSLVEAVRSREAAGDLILEFGSLDESRITAHIEAADLVVFPYKEIDASGALMATLVRNKPVLATAVGGFDELRKLYGAELVFSVPPDDATALANRLAELIASPRSQRSLAVEAHNLLARHPSWADMRDGTLKAYLMARKEASSRLAR